ncbi:MAG: hypothetical protein KatS3mg071_1668 [Meiothermus sp.]|nr:MAG: hypothetical protein KatS3mg071_1668 [Meiothermus sp.]
MNLDELLHLAESPPLVRADAVDVQPVLRLHGQRLLYLRLNLPPEPQAYLNTLTAFLLTRTDLVYPVGIRLPDWLLHGDGLAALLGMLLGSQGLSQRSLWIETRPEPALFQPFMDVGKQRFMQPVLRLASADDLERLAGFEQHWVLLDRWVWEEGYCNCGQIMNPFIVDGVDTSAQMVRLHDLGALAYAGEMARRKAAVASTFAVGGNYES